MTDALAELPIECVWCGEELEELLTEEDTIPQGYADGCLSCGSSLAAWEFYEFVEVSK
jgi:DNA-directed RNA polymerase subunit N (RpoN/RPB10)